MSSLFSAPGDSEIDRIIEVDGGHFLTRRLDGSLSIWSVDADTRSISWIREEKAGADAIAVHPSGEYIVTLGPRGVDLLGFPNLEKRGAPKVDVVLPKRVAFDASGARLVIADRDGLSVWEVSSGNLAERLHTSDAPVAFAYAPNGETVAWSSIANDIVLWKVDGT